MRTENWDSIIRAGIATIVVAITWKLTWGHYDIAAQWEAVFLMVIAYYFKDRPVGMLSETPSLAPGSAE